MFRKMEMGETINHPLCGARRCYTKNHLSVYNRVSSGCIAEGKVIYGEEENSLAHMKWMCKYHIVFTPKYRRKINLQSIQSGYKRYYKQLCSYKGVEIIEGHLMPDHIHMLVSIPPKISVSSFMGYLKGEKCAYDIR